MELEEELDEATELYSEVIKTQMNGTTRVLDVRIKNKNRYHRISQHNYYIKKDYKCPYCTNGSEPILDIEMDTILKDLEKKQKE
ncbi:MAG: hypothetical protein IMZ52_10150 [Actinobacteria bacterium]|nr:hypothetical protein [Actinomycetota bacterium]MBE3122572.1 hypothetical protein [Thermoplasmata archaeon]